MRLKAHDTTRTIRATMKNHLMENAIPAGLIALTALMPLSVKAAEGVQTPRPESVLTQPSKTVTLSQVIDSAIKHAPESAQQEAVSKHASALQRKSNAWLASPPSLNLNYQTDRLNEDAGYSETEAGIDLPLWRPSQKKAWESLADNAGKTVENFPAALRLKVAERVRKSVWDLEEARAAVDLAEKELETDKALENKIRRLVELGDRPKLDQILASQDVLSKERALLNAKVMYQKASSHYIYLTGLQIYPALLEETAGSGSVSLEHPELTAARLKIEQAEHRQTLLRRTAGGQPVLSVNARQETAGDGSEDLESVGVGISFPFGSKTHNGPEYTAAGRAVAEARSELILLKYQLETALNSARIKYQALEKDILLAQKNLQLATRQRQLTELAYESGEVDVVNLLRSQSAFFNAQRELSRLRIERGRTLSKINQALGVSP